MRTLALAGFALGSSALVGDAWAEPAGAAQDRILDLPGTSVALRSIPKGTFQQGSPADEGGREPDEVQRRVSIGHAFWIGKYPVTRGQFEAFVNDTHYVTESEKGTHGGYGWDGKELVQKKEFTWKHPGFEQTADHPVVLVTYDDADAFLAWASTKSGQHLRLPTEAEWEYAARAGTATPWYGATRENEAAALGWFKTNAGNATHPVGKKSANAFGVFDMAGNVTEWCIDVYGPWDASPAIDPVGRTPPSGEPLRRVLRGGSWIKDPKRSRSAARFRSTPGSRNADIGFRVVLDESDPDALTPSPLTTGTGRTSTDPLQVPPYRAPVAPGATETTSSEGPSGLLFVPPAVLLGGLTAWLVRRSAKKRGGDAQGIATRAGADGFWVRSVRAPLPEGTRVRYECIVSGVAVTDVVPLDGREETFVYTGGVPSAIRILEVVAAPAAGNYRGATMPSNDRGRRTGERETPRPVVVPLIETTHTTQSSSDFVGYPRAY